MITAFATMIVIIDPFAIGPMFLALTPGMTPRQRRLIACLLYTSDAADE